MGAFLRRITAIGALWALCELLLPEEGLRRPARVTVGLMASALMLTALGGLAGGAWGLPTDAALLAAAESRAAAVEAGATEKSYREAYLRSQANQLEAYCVRAAKNAGYDARAAVRLTPDGALAGVWLSLASAPGAFVDADTLAARLADALEIDRSLVVVEAGGA